jgi:eukaryotic-like serine/threonine-protein kinase
MGRPRDIGSDSSVGWHFTSEPAVQSRSSVAANPVRQSSLDEALAGARPSAPPGLEVSRAMVAAQLFGIAESNGSLGRFQLLRRMGAGGMGVVYAAYDPALDRMVAVKLVRVSATSGAAAMEEGRALARLSHPNVVPVFEVGYAGEHLYIVMELVIGRTLRLWVPGRRLREVIRAYRQAAEGLAAAHAAGLVHRDFKPDNAIMGSDGRVRVVDFGLARAAEVGERRDGQEAVRRAGTPKYMAPEQVAGASITSAADQYGLCASLNEALTDIDHGPNHPPPRWLRAIVERGCASNPQDRFPSMVALATALGEDPVVQRRRWIAGGVLGAVAVALFVTGRATMTAPSVACVAGQARIATVWGPGGVEVALEPLSRWGSYARSVRQSLLSTTADYEARWASGYRSVCLAHQAGVESDALRDRRMACLEKGKRAVAALASMVVTTNASTVGSLILAVHALPDPTSCSDGQSLIADVGPPARSIAGQVAELRNQLAAARIRLAAGRMREVRDEARAIVARTRDLAYAPLLAEALLVEGHATMAMDERTAAVAPLKEAYTLAFQVGDEALAVEAWARRAWAEGTSAGGRDTLAGSEIVQALADQPSVPSFARALLYNNVGAVEGVMEHRERARTAFERAAREARGVHGPGAAELLSIPTNQALATDDEAQREQLLTRAVAAKAELLGADHPDTLAARWLQGVYTVDFASALSVLAPTCPALRPQNEMLAKHCWNEVAFIQGELDQRAHAAVALEMAEPIRGNPDAEIPSIGPYLRYWRGDVATATEEFAELLREVPRKDSGPWWDREERADLELGLARARIASGSPREARRALDSAVATLSAISRGFPSLRVERRLGRARAELAKTLALLRAPSDEINAQAAPAAAWLRRAGGRGSEIKTLESLLAGGAGVSRRSWPRGGGSRL